LDRERRPTFFEALESWKSAMSTEPLRHALERSEVERFCSLATSLAKKSSIFSTMLDTALDPSAPLEVKLDNGSPFLCPWVVGANGFNSPFGLDTKYGHLVFIFVGAGKLFDMYREISAESLAAGYEMKSAVVVAETEKQLRDAIALRLPLDRQFRIALEGTEDFNQYMAELVEGTIWPESGSNEAVLTPEHP
jgi:hypothetical protein